MTVFTVEAATDCGTLGDTGAGAGAGRAGCGAAAVCGAGGGATGVLLHPASTAKAVVAIDAKGKVLIG